MSEVTYDRIGRGYSEHRQALPGFVNLMPARYSRSVAEVGR
jgi:hypothetical protein